jgi:dienelactone hydrolase
MRPGTLALTMLLAIPATAKMVERKVAYEVDKTKLESVLVYDDAGPARPGLVLIPNWMGIDEPNLKQAAEVARRGYVILVADLFGVTGRPHNGDEAGKISGALKGDRPLLRRRVAAALEQLKAQKGVPLDVRRLGAIGFCFGGTSALELARSGADVAGVVSFHGGLSSPSPADASQIKGKVLALHGADDPFVPPDEVKAFEDEMRAAKLDWQLVKFGNAVHGFTDVDANLPGKLMYDEKATRRGYALMDAFFAEAFK